MCLIIYSELHAYLRNGCNKNMSSLPLLLYTCAPNGEYNTVKLEPVQKDQTPQITALIDFFKKNTLAALLISFLTCS